MYMGKNQQLERKSDQSALASGIVQIPLGRVVDDYQTSHKLSFSQGNGSSRLVGAEEGITSGLSGRIPRSFSNPTFLFRRELVFG